MPLTDSLTVPSLICAELWRRFSRRIRLTSFYSWRYSRSAPEGLVFVPTDLRPADEHLADEYYAGRYIFAQTQVSTLGESPFSMKPPNPEWFSELHSFRWLRHFTASNTDLIQATTTALINDWVNMWGNRLDSDAWTPEVTAARLIAWLSHGPVLLTGANSQTHHLFLKSIGKHVSFLGRNAPYVADGYPRLLTQIALAYSSLCIAGKEKYIAPTAQELDKELDRQILPDGGHISRSPVELVKILTDLIPLKQAYLHLGNEPSPSLQSSIERAMTALRFFSHSDKTLAQFNGTGTTPSLLLKNIFEFSSVKSKIDHSMPYSGFERLANNRTVIVIDSGGPKVHGATQNTMAGTLSFELSSGNNRFITNCGIPENNVTQYAPYARATAAHSTATVGDTSSALFANNSKIHQLLPTPYIRCPKNIIVERNTDNLKVLVRASHDGYQDRFNITHIRELCLSENGDELIGMDHFTTGGQKKLPSVPISIRFHLAPQVSASPLSSGSSILIAAPNGDTWSLTCDNCPIRLEESIQFSGPGEPRKSQQIVISTNPAEIHSVRWSMVRREKPSTPRKRKNKSNQTTPDLLDQLEA